METLEQQKKFVLEPPPNGMHYTTSQGENGELVVLLVPDSPEKAKFFTKISEKERRKVKRWLKKQVGKNDDENDFLQLVSEAIKKVNYDYMIATIEPSVTEEKIYYAKCDKVARPFSCVKWEEMAKEYAPEMGSRLAELYELFIWYALRITNGLWTLDYVVNDSSSGGNFRNAPKSSGDKMVSGIRKCGGYSDGQGNTYKLVAHEDGYALVESMNLIIQVRTLFFCFLKYGNAFQYFRIVFYTNCIYNYTVSK